MHVIIKNIKIVYELHCRLVPIMFLKLPIMLLRAIML